MTRLYEIQIRDRALPNLELSRTYHELFALYERVYHNLVDEFDLLAKLRG